MASVVTVQDCRWIVFSRDGSTNEKSCHRRGLQVESVVMVQECKWVGVLYRRVVLLPNRNAVGSTYRLPTGLQVESVVMVQECK